MENTPLLIKEPQFLLKAIGAFFLGLVAVILLYAWYVRPPANFPSQRITEIHAGSGIIQVARDLQTQGIIRSAVVFEFLTLLSSKQGTIVAGNYYFEKPLDARQVAYRLKYGKFNLAPVRVTIPEGFTIRDISETLSEKLIHFDTATFLALAKDKEGYLFPDTYLFFPTASATTVFRDMSNNFDKKIEKAQLDTTSSVELSRTVIMASILEKEAANSAEMPIVAGILSNRLKKGMPLQVDATFMYLLGKKSSELTVDDLRIDSPYNTYIHKGLPPGPIDNPGMDAILAALHPAKTPYYFYLHDSHGIIHYARTFEEHKANKRKYL